MSYRGSSLVLMLTTLCTLIGFSLFAWSISTKSFLYTSITDFDTSVQVYIKDTASLSLAKIMLFCTHLANPEIIFIALIGLALFLILIHERALAGIFVGGLALGSGLSMYVKHFLSRSRPLEGAFHVAHRGFSFPSGHALLAMVFYGFLGYTLVHSAPKRWQKLVLLISTILIVFCVGYSRVYLGVHWASDVVGGWLLGGFIVCILVFLYRRVHAKAEIHFKSIRGIGLITALIIVVILSFSIFYLYVTQAAGLRSTSDRAVITK
jgi:undecaprenyl-diphosphatase